MNRLTVLSLTSMALLCLAVALPAGNAIAQEKQHVTMKYTAENSKYTQQLSIDVGDRPNHIVRVYGIHFTYPPDNAPVINGLKLVESWARGIGDQIDGSGGGTQYFVYVFENGDRFFAQATQVVQNVEGNLTATNVGPITGGTGKFAGIRGLNETPATSILKRGSSRAKTDIDYSVSK